MIDAAYISTLASQFGVDPALALATADQESGFNSTARGDGGHSIGLFQENDFGAGAGMSFAQRADPIGAVQRFAQRVQQVIASGFSGSPGQVAAEAQKPLDRIGYAASVDALYAQFGSNVTGQSSSSCPPGQVLYNGVCVYVGRGGVAAPPPPTDRTVTPGRPGSGGSQAGDTAPGGYDPKTNSGGRGAATFDPFGGLFAALAALVAPVAVVAVVLILVTLGLKDVAD